MNGLTAGAALWNDEFSPENGAQSPNIRAVLFRRICTIFGFDDVTPQTMTKACERSERESGENVGTTRRGLLPRVRESVQRLL